MRLLSRTCKGNNEVNLRLTSGYCSVVVIVPYSFFLLENVLKRLKSMVLCHRCIAFMSINRPCWTLFCLHSTGSSNIIFNQKFANQLGKCWSYYHNNVMANYYVYLAKIVAEDHENHNIDIGLDNSVHGCSVCSVSTNREEKIRDTFVHLSICINCFHYSSVRYV